MLNITELFSLEALFTPRSMLFLLPLNIASDLLFHFCANFLTYPYIFRYNILYLKSAFLYMKSRVVHNEISLLFI